MTAWRLCFLAVLGAVACSKADDRETPVATGQAASSQPAPANQAGSAPPASAPPPAEPSCPAEMALLPGGRFWVGSDPGEKHSSDESPRFHTELAPFCLDVTEVTARAYAACVERGACSAPKGEHFHCTGGRKNKGDHPINCVTFTQAEAFCKARGARLPSEAEFEFAARGGSRYLKYPWGDAAPDGHTCWKHNGTCPVKSYPAGAFGLFDVSGNVWEWTADYYGPYPFPPEKAFARVYRGGSFSRRFEKWMHTRLRNRAMPWEEGSHLGFRCALTPPAAKCPFGAHDDGRCRHGVLEQACDPGKAWNGVRCAAPGEPRCRAGRVEKPGYGCVLEAEVELSPSDVEAEAKAVSRQRTPEFDADCQTNLRDRPRAFRYAGGTHDARNLVGRRDGCKNRDVGVGWNSACCP